MTLVNSFHGRTLTTLAATGQEHFHQLFQPLTPGFVHVSANDIDQLKKCVEQYRVAGILMEVVQGEGGVLCLTAKDKVRLLPALNIPMEDLTYAIETLKAVAQELG